MKGDRLDLNVFDLNNSVNRAQAVSNQLYKGNYVMFIASPAGLTYTVRSEDLSGDYDLQDVATPLQAGQTKEISFRLDPGVAVDSDMDGIADNVDLCPLTNDVNNQDFDGDGAGDVCDDDDDDDQISDAYELLYPTVLDPFDDTDALLDSDGDGFINRIEFFNDRTDPWDWT